MFRNDVHDQPPEPYSTKAMQRLANDLAHLIPSPVDGGEGGIVVALFGPSLRELFLQLGLLALTTVHVGGQHTIAILEHELFVQAAPTFLLGELKKWRGGLRMMILHSANQQKHVYEMFLKSCSFLADDKTYVAEYRKNHEEILQTRVLQKRAQHAPYFYTAVTLLPGLTIDAPPSRQTV